MTFIPYIVVIVLVLFEAAGIYILQRKRKTLDLTTESGAMKDAQLKKIIIIMIFYTVAMIPLLLYLLLPVFQQAPATIAN